MIKSKMVDKEIEPTFPMLMSFTNELAKLDRTVVVLFYCEGIGTVVYSEMRERYPVGMDSQTWNMGEFKKYNGIITLENS